PRATVTYPLSLHDARPIFRGMRGRIRARVAAGPITLEEFTGELDIAVNAGAVRASGKLTEGESRIRSDAGAVRVELDSSSSVHRSEEHTAELQSPDRRV